VPSRSTADSELEINSFPEWVSVIRIGSQDFTFLVTIEDDGKMNICMTDCSQTWRGQLNGGDEVEVAAFALKGNTEEPVPKSKLSFSRSTGHLEMSIGEPSAEGGSAERKCWCVLTEQQGKAGPEIVRRICEVAEHKLSQRSALLHKRRQEAEQAEQQARAALVGVSETADAVQKEKKRVYQQIDLLCMNKIKKTEELGGKMSVDD